MSDKLSRRDVMRKGAAGAAGAAMVSMGTKRILAQSPSQGTLGANERIRVAVVGIHGQGHGHLRNYSGMKDVEVVYVCDPDSSLHQGRIEDVKNRSEGRSNPKGVQDVRDILDDKNLDAVSIATPNHWHSLITVWACQAGKDVYVEKPMSHNVVEGRTVVKAARKYGRIVQHGTQSRSNNRWAHIAAVCASGKLGKVRVARGLCYKASGGHNTRGDIGFRPIKPAPDHLDFNIWQGPAKHLEYHENLVHYRWHWFWETGNGDLGNQGVHQMDVARWCIPGATLPKSCIAFGGRLGYYDQGEVASTHVAIMDFGESQLIFETRGLPSKDFHGEKIGNIIHLDEGMIIGQKFFPKGSKKEAPLPKVEWSRGPGDGNPFKNFIASMRTRKISDLNAESLEGHYSSALCHLANMSVRLGKKVPFTPRTDKFDDNPAALDTLKRTEEYLAENGMDIEKSGYTMGRNLVVDQKTETIVNDAEANMMLTRDYREGFELPEIA